MLRVCYVVETICIRMKHQSSHPKRCLSWCRTRLQLRRYIKTTSTHLVSIPEQPLNFLSSQSLEDRTTHTHETTQLIDFYCSITTTANVPSYSRRNEWLTQTPTHPNVQGKHHCNQYLVILRLNCSLYKMNLLKTDWGCHHPRHESCGPETSQCSVEIEGDCGVFINPIPKRHTDDSLRSRSM